jgi:hypothetical protein
MIDAAWHFTQIIFDALEKSSVSQALLETRELLIATNKNVELRSVVLNND